MSLGPEARMNEPGHALGNWQWRYQAWQLELLNRESSAYLSELTDLYDR
jgi:4-alpha-glucanotransferase